MTYRENNKSIIRMCFRSPNGYTLLPTFGYDVDVSGRWSWLKRACWRVLNGLGSVRTHFDREQCFTEVSIDPNLATEKILLESAYEFSKAGRNIERILVGAEDLARMMRDPSLGRLGPFGFTGNIAFRDPESEEKTWRRCPPGYTWCSIPVHVIPHMQGVLVI